MNYNFDHLMSIIKRLRDPETGCPWDKEQTHSSLVPNFIEELYECVEAIDHNDFKHLSEELGDLLLHIGLQIEIAEEQGKFDEQLVFQKIIDKLITRHPHIFNDDQVLNSSEVKTNWEKIKLQEKKHRTSVLEGIPLAMSSLVVAQRTQEKAASTGFDWDSYEPIFSKFNEEIEELEVAIANNDPVNIEEEIGDILFTVVNLSRKLGFDSDTALRKSNDKFTKRFKALEKHYKDTKKDLQSASLEEMDAVWDKVKEQSI